MSNITKREDQKPVPQTDALATFAMHHSAGLAAIGIPPAKLTENPALGAEVIHLYTQERAAAVQHREVVQMIARALVDIEIKQEAEARELAIAKANEGWDKLVAQCSTSTQLKSRYNAESTADLMAMLTKVANGAAA
jgi:hypothetical protein